MHGNDNNCIQEFSRPIMWCKWDNNINRNVAEIRFGDVYWFHLVLNRILWQIAVHTVMNLWVP